MKITAYLRRSKEDQASSLDVQRASLALFVEIHAAGADVAVFEETGSRDAPLDKRPQLADAILHAKRTRADVFWVYKLDRLAGNVLVQETVVAQIRKAGARFHVEEGGGGGEDPTADMVRTILGAVNAFEVATLRARTRAALREKRRQGKPTGRARLGTRNVDGRTVPDANEAAAVVRTLALHAAGEGVSSIARTLTAEGFETRSGRPWHSQQVARMLDHAGVAWRTRPKRPRKRAA